MNKIRYYNHAHKELVCPCKCDGYHNHKDLLNSLRLLGCVGVEAIEMPIADLDINFYKMTLPNWLVLDTDDGDAGMSHYPSYYFNDAKGRQRLRVITDPIMISTTVWTRFQPRDFTQTNAGKLVPCVFDVERDDDAPPIWVGKRVETDSLWDIKGAAEKWLDGKYPDWRNPMAYWT